MRSESGVEIIKIESNSLAEQSGIEPGDIILSVNSYPVRDPVDFMYYSSDDILNIELKRNEKIHTITIKRRDEIGLGIEFKPFKVRTCRNNCIFCFVKQLPKGLRKTLYVKDEDYRLSFLYGNYITLSNITKEDKKRIVEQRLSPLYISVHSTNRTLRNKLIGNPKGPDIMKEMKFFADNKIRFNAQIVLCPGYNDGKELHQTISNLFKFYPYLLSIAVVPVGLTIYHKQSLNPVEKADAENALKTIEYFQKRFVKKHGNPIVYGADELYLKAGIPFPHLKEYRELYQLENGVGMLPLFLNQVKKLKINKTFIPKKKILTFTGTSFYPYLNKFIEKLREKERISIDLLEVENRFFGPSITVAGLISGRDIIKSILDRTAGYDKIFVPDVTLNSEDKFLDDVALSDIKEATGIPAVKIPSTPEGLIENIFNPA